MNIGFIGTGLMGSPMVERLLSGGYTPRIYNRTTVKTHPLAMLGAVVENKPEDVIKKSDTIIFMLADYNAVNATMFANEKQDFSGKTVIQMSTISPEENLTLAGKVIAAGGHFVEAPVLGSIPQIISGDLIVMFGGDKEAYHKWHEFFTIFGEKIIYTGKTGSASSVKLALNHLIASLTASFSLSLGYLREKEIDIDMFMEILRSSALYAPTFDKKLGNMMSDNFDSPNFPLKHMLKDVDLILNEFKGEGLNTPQLEGVKEVIKDALDQGLSEKDYSSLYKGVHKK